jgi:hypothetical protein
MTAIDSVQSDFASFEMSTSLGTPQGQTLHERTFIQALRNVGIQFEGSFQPVQAGDLEISSGTAKFMLCGNTVRWEILRIPSLTACPRSAPKIDPRM